MQALLCLLFTQSGHSTDLYLAFNSCRTMFAPSTIARILPKATSRGRYFSPQSGATTMRSADTWDSARLIRAATVSGLSIAMSDRSSVPSMIILPGSFCNTEQSRLDCAVSMEICCTGDSANSGRNE